MRERKIPECYYVESTAKRVGGTDAIDNKIMHQIAILLYSFVSDDDMVIYIEADIRRNAF